MKNDDGALPRKDEEASSAPQPRTVRLPGFLIEEEIGLGDAIKYVTNAMGIQPCGGCEKRAATLNRWVRFSR
jgi:hypothetical protein